jgi:sialate O-acetylesterase
MIESWRHHFENPGLPFFFVLLANFNAEQNQPVELGWGEIREAQLEALRLPNTGAASAIDVGMANDIHPTDKQTVGHRLALQARALVHHEKKLVYSGPAFREARREGNRVRLLFNHTGSSLKIRNAGPLKGFAVRAAAEGPWRWAQAEIDGDAVLISTTELPEIKEVRYAWASNPIGNLANQEGLPANPFRVVLP